MLNFLILLLEYKYVKNRHNYNISVFKLCGDIFSTKQTIVPSLDKMEKWFNQRIDF